MNSIIAQTSLDLAHSQIEYIKNRVWSLENKIENVRTDLDKIYLLLERIYPSIPKRCEPKRRHTDWDLNNLNKFPVKG